MGGVAQGRPVFKWDFRTPAARFQHFLSLIMDTKAGE